MLLSAVASSPALKVSLVASGGVCAFAMPLSARVATTVVNLLVTAMLKPHFLDNGGARLRKHAQLANAIGMALSPL